MERRQPTTTRGSSSSTVDLVKGAQKLVNNLRKAETKVRKTEEELCHVAEQWSVFQEGLKKAFIKERGKYLEAMRTLKEEQETNLANQEEALNDLQDALSGNTAKAPVEHEAPTMEEEQAWDALLQEGAEDDDMGLTDLLAGAMSGRGEARQAAKQRMLKTIAEKREKLHAELAPKTPQSRRTYSDALTPPTTDKPSVTSGANPLEARAARDPYQSSPSTLSMSMPDGVPRTKPGRIPVKQVGRAPSRSKATGGG